MEVPGMGNDITLTNFTGSSSMRFYRIAEASCYPVINEVMTGTSASSTDEFVEIYNPCPYAMDLNGWKLVYRSASNVNPVSGPDSAILVTWTNVVIPAGGYLVYGGNGILVLTTEIWRVVWQV